MRYMLLIYGAEGAWEGLAPDVRESEMAAYFAFTEALRKAGKYIAGDELAPVATARSVKVGAKGAAVLDGPYVDTKEQFGGYYLIEAASMDEAVDWAKQCPGARHGGIEVRPCMDHGPA